MGNGGLAMERWTKTELRIAACDVNCVHEIFFDDMKDMPDGTVTAHMDELEYTETEDEIEKMVKTGIPFVLFHAGDNGCGKAAFDGVARVTLVTDSEGVTWPRVDPETGEVDPDSARNAKAYFEVERCAVAAMIMRDAAHLKGAASLVRDGR